MTPTALYTEAQLRDKLLEMLNGMDPYPNIGDTAPKIFDFPIIQAYQYAPTDMGAYAYFTPITLGVKEGLVWHGRERIPSKDPAFPDDIYTEQWFNTRSVYRIIAVAKDIIHPGGGRALGDDIALVNAGRLHDFFKFEYRDWLHTNDIAVLDVGSITPEYDFDLDAQRARHGFEVTFRYLSKETRQLATIEKIGVAGAVEKED